MAVKKDINEALMNDILMIYSDAEDKMLKAVAKRVAKGIKSEGWNETKLKDTQKLKKEIEAILGDTKKLSSATISKGIIDAYKSGTEEVDGVKGTHKTVLDELDIPMNLKMLVLSTNHLLDNASFQVLRKSNDVYQQVMAHATTGLLAGTDTRIQASQKMLNEYASKGITTFVDKAGRNWDLSSYAEMCARTVGSHAALQGHIDRQIEVGEDLVKVSSIGTTCPICQRWQGVVLSISGNSPKYHSLDEAKSSGLFHPNCKHTLVMYVPGLDEGTEFEGKVEPAPLDMTTNSSKRNKLIEKQRANERQIRYWKKRKALAITPHEQKKCDEKIKAWQYKNLIHCEKNGLRRQYAREGVMKGNATGPKGTFIGGSLKEYEEVYKAVVGSDAKKTHKTLLKMNLQFFANKSYDKWLKEEIQSLDELDVDKAMMKDASNKAVTPTSLYKKYIGDNPAQDYAEVSEFEKGTKEYKTGYAKWLKQQIEEIGVSYKIKPKYVEVHEDIPIEDQSLSATVIYKKYHDGKAPTEAYKEAGGEAGTGMKYGKWVETQKKELIKNGITKTVPFSNSAVQKNATVISHAQSTISQAKDSVHKAQLDAYQAELDSSVHGNYDGYLKVKEALQDMKSKELYTDDNEHEAYKLAKEKLKLAEEKHIEMVKKKAEKTFGTQQFDDDLMKLTNMLLDETDEEMHSHIDNQIKAYNDVKKAKEAAKAKAEEEAKKKAEDAAKKAAELKAKATKEAGKVSLARETSFKEGKLVRSEDIYQELDYADLDILAKQAKGNKLMKAERRDVLGRDKIDGHNHHMGHNVTLVQGADPELGKAMQLFYDEYINTIKCGPINDACVKGYEHATPQMKKKIDAIDKVIASCEIDTPVKVHRFVSDEVAQKMFGKLDMSELSKGKVIESPAFMSATVSGHSTFEKRNFMMTIQCDKGTHMMPTLNYEEGEVLLGRNGKLEVVDVIDHSKNGKKLKHYDGSEGTFKGKEIVVRYIEQGKASQYEVVTPEKIDAMLGNDDVVSRHRKQADAWISDMDPNGKEAIVEYTGSLFSAMNDVYRRDDRSHKKAVKYAEDATKELRRISTTEPIVLRRGINSSDLAHMLGFNGDVSAMDSHLDEVNKGGYAAEDKGFLSCSPFSGGGFQKSVELRIWCPSGTHAGHVATISHFKSEKETLLQSGSLYDVLKVEKNGPNYIAYLELLGTD